MLLLEGRVEMNSGNVSLNAAFFYVAEIRFTSVMGGPAQALPFFLSLQLREPLGVCGALA
jgi:hypothetical protein